MSWFSLRVVVFAVSVVAALVSVRRATKTFGFLSGS